MSNERMELGLLSRPIAMPSLAQSEDRKHDIKWATNGGSDGAAELSPASSGSSSEIPHKVEAEEGGNNNNSMDTGNMNGSDAEGVWSQDIDQAFQEALAIYPPCGRRKIILSDEGKMYGRNELIARYIKLRTGKTRTRKQVSSHIQVLARKKQREIQAKMKDHVSKEKAMSSLSHMSSAQIVSMGAFNNKLAANFAPSFLGPASPLQPGLWGAGGHMGGGLTDLSQGMGYGRLPTTTPVSSYSFAGPPLPLTPNPQAQPPPPFEGRTIWTPKFRLCEFSSYCQPEESKSRHEIVRIDNTNVSPSDPLLETIPVSEMADKFPGGREGLSDLFEKGPQDCFFLVKFWADISFNPVDDNSAFYGVDSRYEGKENIPISVSTKVCSFGKQVVEKVETEFPLAENGDGTFVYRIQRSPMCEYMVKFINELKKLPEKYMMNSVLENFTILQVVTNKDTRETLLVIAFVFEISPDNNGSTSYNLYRLVPNS